MAGNMKLIVSRETQESCAAMMRSLSEGKIKKHLLGNSSQRRQGFIEQRELEEYKDFIKTRGFAEIMELGGNGSSFFDEGRL